MKKGHVTNVRVSEFDQTNVLSENIYVKLGMESPSEAHVIPTVRLHGAQLVRAHMSVGHARTLDIVDRISTLPDADMFIPNFVKNWDMKVIRSQHEG